MNAILNANINDKTSTLIALSHRLRDCVVTAYYLHRLNQVQEEFIFM